MHSAALRAPSTLSKRNLEDDSHRPLTSHTSEEHQRPPTYAWNTSIDRSVTGNNQLNDAVPSGSCVHSTVPFYLDDCNRRASQKLAAFVDYVTEELDDSTAEDAIPIRLFERKDPDGAWTGLLGKEVSDSRRSLNLCCSVPSLDAHHIACAFDVNRATLLDAPPRGD